MKKHQIFVPGLALFLLAGCTPADIPANYVQSSNQPAAQVAPATNAIPSTQNVQVEGYELSSTSFGSQLESATDVEQGEATAPTEAPNGYYRNVDGNLVPSPYYAPSAPAGASARCRDGTYSFSQNRQGTCSHHGG